MTGKRTPPATPSAAELRTMTVGYLDLARSAGASRVLVELERDGQRVEVLIEREATPAPVADDGTRDGEPTLTETVTVKVGPKSRPRTVVAVPAEWL